MTEQPSLVAASAPGAVAVAGSVGGSINTTVNNNYAGRPPVSWPHRIGVVPALAQGYQHRAEAQGLHLALDNEGPGRTVVLTQVLAGMGGIGKTQLAAGYAHQQWQTKTVDLLMWITASSRDSILSGYAEAGADLTDPRTGQRPSRSPAGF